MAIEEKLSEEGKDFALRTFGADIDKRYGAEIGYAQGAYSYIEKACECLGKMIQEWNCNIVFDDLRIDEEKAVARFKKTIEEQ